jgi:cytochrome c biogenesis protein CcmG/thiol:disulfide interchange protein DsbE
MMKYTGFFLALMLFAATPSCSSGTPREDDPNKAPNFVLMTADGRTIELEELKGRVVVLNFWATWCGPCRAEIPGMLEVYEKYRGDGLEIVGISLDRGGWNVVTPFVERMGVDYPVVLGGGAIVQKYGGFQAIPTTFIVNKQGNVVNGHTGYLSKDDLEVMVKNLL